MYDSDRAAAIEFIRGAGFVILIMGIFFGFIATLGEFDPPSAEKFVVEDSYKGCDVVRYMPPKRAESVYFLDCRKVR
jgi:hypothetical protein